MPGTKVFQLDCLPQNQQWHSEERIQETIRVWSNAYGRRISREEAVEIITNVRRFAEVLLKAMEGRGQATTERT